MALSLIVIDDFLTNPEEFRASALKLNYSLKGHYPGLNSVEHIAIDGLEQHVSAIVQEPVRAPLPLESHSRCRLTLAEHDEPGKIHIDPTHWSGILYLSKPEHCRGGTEFYRHLPTGTDRVPTTPEALNAVGYSSYDELKQEVLEKDAYDRSRWELTMTVPMRFNRLILLQPQYWHTSGPGFGQSVEDGRLIYLMFFRRAVRL